MDSEPQLCVDDRDASRAAELRAMAARLISIANSLDRTPQGDTLWRSVTAEERGQLSALVWAEAEYNGRRRREDCVSRALLGEPAWDMLLHLFIQEAHRKEVTLSSACRAAGTSHTTALRWLSVLEQEGMVERVPAPNDRRTHHVQLTGQAKLALTQWLNQRAAL